MAKVTAKELEAAGRLEDLIVMAKEMVTCIRDGSERQPYAAMYWLRRELGYAVRDLGEGVPNTAEVENYYRQQVQK